MGVTIRGGMKRKAHFGARFGVVYWAMLVLSLHWAVVTYINSTYLHDFISEKTIGVLYVVGSTITIFSFLCISRILKGIGNYTLTVGLAITELLVLIGMALSHDVRIIVALFIIHHAVVPLLLFNLDVFLESFIGKQEEHTGGKRGLLLTIMSLAGAFAPLLTGYLVGSDDPRFYLAYAAGALLMLPFLFLIFKHLKDFKDPAYKHVEVFSALNRFWVHKDLRFVFLAHFLLQLFFAWMVIYTPLYLATVVGFNWNEIGVILFFGLLAYVFFEYPIGQAADLYIGEKEMMAVGFLILAVTTGWLSFIPTASLIPWIITLFLTRIGAALVETTTESYFFKHIAASDANVISFFRITRPLSYIVGPLLGSFALLYVSFPMLFVIFGLCLIPGIFFALMITDTK